MEADGVLAMVRWVGLSIHDFTRGAPNWGPPPEMEKDRKRRFDTRAIYEAVDGRRGSNGMTWKQLASELEGFSAPMLIRLARRGRMSIEQVVALSAWVGMAPENFTRHSVQ